MATRQFRPARAARIITRVSLGAIVALCAISLPRISASDYLGGGQSEEVNAILNPEVLVVRNGFGQDLITVPITQSVMLVPLGQGGSSAELQYLFSGADPATFSARLWKRVLGTADLSAQGVRVIDVPIASGRNAVVASVSGTTQSGQKVRDSDRITLVCCVPETEQPPVANAGPDQYSVPASLVFLDGLGSSDPNGDELTYHWEQVSGPAVTLSDPNSPTPSFRFPSVFPSVSLELELTVSDGLWTSFPDRVRISYIGDEPPYAEAGPDQVVLSGSAVTLDGSRSYDSSGGEVTCVWRQTVGPYVLPPDPSGCILTFTAPQVSGTVILTFELTVTDVLGLFSRDATNVTIVP
jgi:hypothetical protein